MSDVHLLIFDWDGTLSDSVGRIVQTMQYAADAVGLAVPGEQAVRDIIGLGLPEAIAALFPELEDPAVAEALVRAYAAQYIALEETPCSLFPGVLEALDSLRSAGFLLAVATGKSRRGLDRVLRQHGLLTYFDATRCADETASKPDPLMLWQILAELSVDPNQAVMLGDSQHDLLMAANAGLRGFGVAFGAQSAEHLLRHGAAFCVENFWQFHDWALPRFGARRSVEV
ncbi:HAD-IA family hydrolase [Pseudomonas sp.]|jgi:phosphoglycolate phosphatase|uniref:HAD-IA family hydrolase n=1 Tax=Pseudomonas sp. TaxID=306 RepID=UPI00272D8656|nr:HAD-IA family hydrolase [Pseudomonas sp.]